MAATTNAPTVSTDPPSFASLHIVDSPSPDPTSESSPEPEDSSTAPTDRRFSPSLLHVQEVADHVDPQTHKHPPRNRSPYGYSRSHLRSHSATSAQPMARTRSLPSVGAATSFSYSPSHSPVRPSSPLRSPAPTRVNPRRSFEESLPQSSLLPSFMDIESIAEDSELDIQPRGGTPLLERELQSSPIFTTPSYAGNSTHAHTFPRPSSSNGRRRPQSPLYHSQGVVQSPAMSFGSTQSGTSPSSSTSSPATSLGGKFNEAYPIQPPAATSSSSSMPSTPTSVRSRSPSISSLETIPDTPDAEEAAIESFNIAKLKAAADAADEEEAAETERRNRRGGAIGGVGSSARDKRKRWSVCGAERRGDFEMETIWED